jgi:Papain family cysteine protease
MELAIRYIGPISVGFNGADPTFLSYRSGIYYKRNCKQTANHALLIVGYGQEEESKSKVIYNETEETKYFVNETVITKYWIARNSWGTGWGENGYVKIRRGDGKKGSEGVCGISRSPSVALGGVLLRRINNVLDPKEAFEAGLMNNPDEKSTSSNLTSGFTKVSRFFKGDSLSDTDADYQSGTIDEVENEDTETLLRDMNTGYGSSSPTPTSGHRLCNNLGFDERSSLCQELVQWMESHTMWLLLFIGIVINMLVIWPLSRDFRIRRQRRLMRRASRSSQQYMGISKHMIKQQQIEFSDGVIDDVNTISIDESEDSPLFRNSKIVSYGT